ncbi:DUF1465 family protein [Denitrobaculum tricleocarpae]|uniref:DUF1465 family protein n=2 Tax=Denitrobaculum tricleocarpae TaxID=2591009 RepID=A0A545TYS5_9PROT|nr:DUF1465 family protein [Denitrobaculum tricleocarpae]
MTLMREARDYLTHHDRAERAKMTPEAQLWASSETMRLTARLTQIMAWLLIQKAVHAGEISRADAASAEHRLSGQEVCDTNGCLDEVVLQPKLVELLDRSHRLYQRVARLDSMLDSVA